MKKSEAIRWGHDKPEATAADLERFGDLYRAWNHHHLGHATVLWGDSEQGEWAAQALIHTILCEGDTPMASCRACRSPLAHHPDFVEVRPDGRHIKLAQIHALDERLDLCPLWSRQRVIWIAEADSLTVEAQNALLKGLEEPRVATLWVLTTRYPDRLLTTVRSRCQVFRVSCLVGPSSEPVQRPEFGISDALESDLRIGALWARQRFLDTGEGQWLTFWEACIEGSGGLEANANRDLLREHMQRLGQVLDGRR